MDAHEFKKCYFLAPTRNYVPDKRIRMGNIIANPSVPDEPLNESPFTPSPDTIDIHSESGWSTTYSKQNETKLSFLASFLQLILGLGGKADAGYETSVTQTLNCEKVVTSEFNPSLSFVDHCVKDEAVSNYLKARKQFYLYGNNPKKVYMITGLKIAHGASQVFEAGLKRNIHLHLTVDGTTAGLPASGGPEFNVTRNESQGEDFKASDAFVLGYRLREIELRAKGDIAHKAYDTGATLGKDNTKKEGEIEIVVEGIGARDARGADFKREEYVVQGEAGDEEYLCVNPT